MANSEEVGSLHGAVTFDADELFKTLKAARNAFVAFANEVQTQFAQLAERVETTGKRLTVGVTAPFAALVVVSGKTAGEFEAAMNRIEAAFGSVSPEKLEALSQAAQKLGPEVGRSALEAAEGIESLALAGLSADAVLGGALDATLKLAAANDAELAPAAALVTDVMAQFSKTSSELPPIVDKITGALDSSKFSFIDLQQAISQAGGVAGSVGVTLEDFLTTLAATSPLFSSGADAGTSFKSFLSSLNPKSEEAAYTMEVLAKRIGETGNLFYDTSGEMKNMADIAEVLREALNGLSAKSRAEALNNLFGADGMRTAIALMQQGREGIARIQAQIDQSKADDKLAIQLRGLQAETRGLAASFDALKIALGEAGVITALTSLAAAARYVVQSIADLPQGVLTAGLAFGALAAAVGPFTLAALSLGRLGLPLLAARFGALGIVISALINPLGTVVALIGGHLARAAFTAIAPMLGLAAAASATAGVVGLLATGLIILVASSSRAAVASATYTKVLDQANKIGSEAIEISLALATATGKARQEALKNAYAKRIEAVNTLRSAQAKIAETQATLALAQAEAQRAAKTPVVHGPVTSFSPDDTAERHAVAQAQANAKAAQEALDRAWSVYRGLNSSIEQAESIDAGANLSFEKPEKPKKVRAGKGDKSTSDRTAEDIRLEAELEAARLRNDDERVRAIQDQIDLKRQINDYEDVGLTKAAARLAAERDMADIHKARAEADARDIADQERGLQIEVAEKTENLEQAKILRDQEDLQDRINFFRSKGLTLEEATTRAKQQQLALEEATAAVRARWLQDDALDRRIRLADLRGDSEETLRHLREEQEIRRRTREIRDAGGGEISEESAYAQAVSEAVENEQARIQGVYRDAVRGGVRAALDGSFGDWFENWWKDRLLKALDSWLNRLADGLAQVVQQNAGGIGGILSSIGSAIGLVSGSGSGDVDASRAAHDSVFSSLPKMATGGTIDVKGFSGIDRNMLSVNGVPAARVMRGETIRVDPNDGGRSRVAINMPITLDARGADPAALGRMQARLDQFQREIPGIAVQALAEAEGRRFK